MEQIKMKKNITIGLLGLILVMVLVFSIGKLNKEGEKTSSLTRELKQEKKEHETSQKDLENLQVGYSELEHKKNNYVVTDLTETATTFFNAYLTLNYQSGNNEANQTDFNKRKAEAQKVASQEVVDKYFQPAASGASVTSEVESLQVFVENKESAIVTAIVTYNLRVTVGETLNRKSGFYNRIQFDTATKKIISSTNVGQVPSTVNE